MKNDCFEHLTDEQIQMLAVEFETYLKEKPLDYAGKLFLCFDVFIGAGIQTDLNRYKMIKNNLGLKVLFLAFAAGFDSKSRLNEALH